MTSLDQNGDSVTLPLTTVVAMRETLDAVAEGLIGTEALDAVIERLDLAIQPLGSGASDV
jgi:hypothetical protein